MSLESELPDEKIAEDQGTEQNPWPHPKPDYMTETHTLLLKEFWSEGLTPTGMIAELVVCIPELGYLKARAIVMYWMWFQNIRVGQ